MHDILFQFLSQYLELTNQEKQIIIDLDIFKSVKKGETLLRAGEKSQEGYFVLKGCIRVYYIIDGEEKTTAFHTEMEGLTPNCVVTKQPSGYYIAASEDSIITVSTPDMEQTVFEQFPKFEKLCRLLSEDLLAKKQIDFDQFKTSSPEQRYQNLLDARPDLIQRVPQYQLASFLGITPQSLSRLKSRVLKK